MKVEEIISLLKKKISNSVTFDGASVAKIDFTNAMLKNNKLSDLPEEYQKFLMETNGFIVPPFEFYGTEIFDRNDFNYRFPNVVEVNLPLVKNQNPLIEQRVIIGSVFFDMIIFDGIDRKFKIMNRVNFETIKTFESFEKVLEYLQENLTEK